MENYAARNQIFYAAWKAGLLSLQCYEEPETLSLPRQRSDAMSKAFEDLALAICIVESGIQTTDQK